MGFICPISILFYYNFITIETKCTFISEKGDLNSKGLEYLSHFSDIESTEDPFQDSESKYVESDGSTSTDSCSPGKYEIAKKGAQKNSYRKSSQTLNL